MRCAPTAKSLVVHGLWLWRLIPSAIPSPHREVYILLDLYPPRREWQCRGQTIGKQWVGSNG